MSTMTRNIYKETRNELTKTILELSRKYAALRLCWQKVEILRKPDGTDYQIISKSIKNAEYYDAHATRYIQVITDDAYYLDRIYLTEKDDNERYRFYSAEELEALIENRINELAEKQEIAIKQLNQIDETSSEFICRLEEAEERLEETLLKAGTYSDDFMNALKRIAVKKWSHDFE